MIGEGVSVGGLICALNSGDNLLAICVNINE
jgi:hypothetical protein